MKTVFESTRKCCVFVLFFILTLNTNAQITFDICIQNAYTGGGSGQFIINNPTQTAFAAGSTIEFSWPGITSISPWYGATVTGTSPYVITLTDAISANGSLTFGFSFTSNGSYFSPPQALLNGTIPITLVSPPCYIPPSFQNYSCETTIESPCAPIGSSGANAEIKLGEGKINVWNSTLNAYIPTNRKKWAIGLAVSHSLFTHLVGFDVMSINESFATALQETNCGCDGAITTPAWVTNPYPNWEQIAPVYCADYTHAVANGFFQMEHGTGWAELSQDIPCFIPTIDYDTVVVGKNYAGQLIVKAYHDYNNLMFLQYIRCYDVLGFLQQCADPYGAEKIISATYNRGMNDGFLQSILVTNRTTALTAPDLLTYIPGLGQQYAEQISRITATLDNNLNQVSTYGTSTYSIPWPGNHSHHGFYNETISWSDVDAYLNDIAPVYEGVNVNMNTIKNNVMAVFNQINNGNPLSYRYQMNSVIEKIVSELPAFDPMFGLGQVYGNSGGNSCTSYPSARLDSTQLICPGETPNLTLYLTGQWPWSITYTYNGTPVTINNITSTPYVLPAPAIGTYQLVSIVDGNGNDGDANCDSVNISIDPACLPLPVVLESFEAIANNEGRNVDIFWHVLSQSDLTEYIVEKSLNGRDWIKVGEIKQTNQTDEQSYALTDEQPFIGTAYYRLKMISQDGLITYSQVQSVQLKLMDITLLPNPADDYFYITGLNNGTVNVFDVHHRPIGTFEIVNNPTKIDASFWSPGVYFVQVNNQFHLHTERIVITDK